MRCALPCPALQVDKAIDKCGALQNLREAIYDCLQTSENPPPRPPQKEGP
jgi:hypothetical protein